MLACGSCCLNYMDWMWLRIREEVRVYKSRLGFKHAKREPDKRRPWEVYPWLPNSKKNCVCCREEQPGEASGSRETHRGLRKDGFKSSEEGDKGFQTEEMSRSKVIEKARQHQICPQL